MVFEPYRRSLDIEDLILALYSNGISTRRISMILDEIFHGRYSIKYNKQNYRCSKGGNR